MFQNPHRLYDVHHGNSAAIDLVFQVPPSNLNTVEDRMGQRHALILAFPGCLRYRVAVRVGNRTLDPVPGSWDGNLHWSSDD